MDEVRGDGKYNNRPWTATWTEPRLEYKVTVVKRPAGVKGYVHLQYRWVVERTNAWVGQVPAQQQGLRADDESAEAMLKCPDPPDAQRLKAGRATAARARSATSENP